MLDRLTAVDAREVYGTSREDAVDAACRARVGGRKMREEDRAIPGC